MSVKLASSFCSIHASRPATARCPSCRSFFCSECVTEHEGKLICASCLAAASAERGRDKSRWRDLHPAPWLQLGLALAIMWVLFHFFARFLGDIPDSFHDGTIWE